MVFHNIFHLKDYKFETIDKIIGIKTRIKLISYKPCHTKQH
jgi:hypothetical protein